MEFQDIIEQSKKAKHMTGPLVQLTSDEKNRIITRMAEVLMEDQEVILAANQVDLDASEANGLTNALIDRLKLCPSRIEGMSESLRVIVSLPDPVGRILESLTPKNGLKIDKVSVPIGVIAIIYESRPNVTADVAGLCIKSGNAVILKGGREAFFSNKAIVASLHRAIKDCGHDVDMVQLIQHTDREAVKVLLQQNECIDLIIPRGGVGLIKTVVEISTIPVLKHLNGVCHTYIDLNADLDKAQNIVMNAKCQRPGVCNAMETLLVHADISEDFLKALAPLMLQENVKLIGCEKTRKILVDVQVATEKDWSTEYLDLILSIRIVDDVKAAIDHINRYGSGHSDAIVTEKKDAAATFLKFVDSAAVYHNVSTRFTDGAAFGKGAEMGISTDKLHARGPVGLEELTTYKYNIYGNGEIR
jgi:glutamate-5-semialdehyde dehydrogenase